MAKDRFGEEVAARYDDGAAAMFAPSIVEPAVDFLAGFSAGRALEFGIGTGRIALPLAARGVRVHGIDLSAAMVERLRAKPRSEEIEVTIGDFATTRVEGSFPLVYLVFNTIMNLTTQDEQIRCFANAATHLAEGGCFVTEVVVPGLSQLEPGEWTLAFDGGHDEYDVAEQRLVSHYDSGRSAPFRYVWPAELDLMARLAGMNLRERWADWNREPFTSQSAKHVSVWERAG